jgi:type IV pilus assembly protein PilB
VTLVIAQRLARRLHECKKPLDLPREALLKDGFTPAQLDSATIYDAIGCDMCNEGFKGRTGIYQVMPMVEELQKIVLAGGSAIALTEASAAMGIPDLRQSARKKVVDGVTSLAEIHRVTVD